MSDIEPEVDPIQQQREHIKDLESQLAASKEQVDLASALERENVMLKAGVDTESALGKMFSRAYDGELTVDAVRTQAAEVGALNATAPPAEPNPDITPEEAQQSRERSALSTDAGVPGAGQEPDLVEAAWAQRADDLRSGLPQDTAAASVIAAMIGEANAGNPRYRYDPDTWRAQQEERMGIR